MNIKRWVNAPNITDIVKLNKYKTHQFICRKRVNVFLLKYCDSNIAMFRRRCLGSLLTQSSFFSLIKLMQMVITKC